jgi:hypothetical protein
MPSTYEPIATQTLGSTASTVTFSSIPSTYTDILLIQSSRLNTAAHTRLQFNGDTATNYSSTILYGTGTTAGSGRYTNVVGISYGASDEQGAASTYNVGQWNIQNYANANTFKTVLINISNPLAEKTVGAGLWRNTAAISSIVLTPTNSAIYQIGSTFTLYGIKSA